MTGDEIVYEPIGWVHSAFAAPEDVPKRKRETVDTTGTIEIDAAHAEGLTDIEGFSHLLVVAHLHEVDESVSRADPPFAPDRRPGIFATRGPRRPNPVGVSIVRLVERTGTTLTVEGLDLIDGTPVLDLKPFAPKAGEFDGLEGGWIEAETEQSFARFREGEG